MYYIGVDLGTSSVKLILMEASGNIVNTVSKSYPIYFPKPGWSEQNPYDWYDKTCEGIRELVEMCIRDRLLTVSKYSKSIELLYCIARLFILW